jgi:AbrB family looped-hinge helix DNA binding protein
LDFLFKLLHAVTAYLLNVLVTIPKEICEHVNLKKGDMVNMWADNSHVIIEKKE